MRRFVPASGSVSRAVLVLAACLSVLAAACGSRASSDGAEKPTLPPEFTTPVAAAQEAGLTVYWVDRQFDTGGRTFVATGARFEGETSSFARVYYQSLSEDGGAVAFTLTSSPPEGYDDAVARVASRPEHITQQHANVRGWPAELFGIRAGPWTNRLVVVGGPGAVIVAQGDATVGRGNTQVNPLNDPDALLAVLQNLRPYPE
jgi:hypothetical protein